MKTLRFIVFALLSVPMLLSCGKPEELNPELVASVTGNYPFMYVLHEGQTYAIEQTNLSGSASIEKKSENSVKLSWTYKGGTNTKSGSYTGVSLIDAGDGMIKLTYSGKTIGSVSDGVLHYVTEDADGKPLTFIGSR